MAPVTLSSGSSREPRNAPLENEAGMGDARKGVKGAGVGREEALFARIREQNDGSMYQAAPSSAGAGRA
jgi:hypothetical protein